MSRAKPQMGRRHLRAGALALILIAFATSVACARGHRAPGIKTETDPHALERRSGSRLRSPALDISLPYQETDRRRPLFGIIRLRNRTRAPIYPQLSRVTIERPGREPEVLALACERFRRKLASLAPSNTLWCSDTANPATSVELPIEIAASPQIGAPLEFDIVVPVVFDTGDPVLVRFGNRIDRGDWRLTLPLGRGAASPATPPPPSTSPAPSVPSEPPAPPSPPAAVPQSLTSAGSTR